MTFETAFAHAYWQYLNDEATLEQLQEAEKKLKRSPSWLWVMDVWRRDFGVAIYWEGF